jgi:hypothetical protein
MRGVLIDRSIKRGIIEDEIMYGGLIGEDWIF